MSLAENISERLSYKFYASGALDSNQLAVPSASANPGATGAQQLRFVNQNLSLTKADIQNPEKRTDRQQPLGRQGTQRIQGSINGIMSPLTYADFFEAALRGTWAAIGPFDASDFTSVAATAGATGEPGTITLGGGDPLTAGVRVGMSFRATGLADADNNDVNFLILAMSGTNGRDLTVWPSPETMSADTSFTLTFAGARVIIPTSNHVSRLLAVESYQQDLDLARLFTEARIGGFNIGLTADQLATIEWPLLGRGEYRYSTSNSPYFSSPTAQTTTAVCGPIGGILRINGENQGVVTAFSFGCQLNPQAPSVLFQNFPPEVFLGAAAGAGNITFFMENFDLYDTFATETRVELFATFPNDPSNPDSDFISFYMPRVQLGSMQTQDDASGGKTFSGPFTFGPYEGTPPTGVDPSMIQIVDSLVTP